MSLTNIFNKYNSDKNSSFHNYCRQYESILAPYREKEIRLLEIGVLGGESLKIWREVFPNAKVILGVDINPACVQFHDAANGVYVEIANATQKQVLEHLSKTYGPFDVILDDGSHCDKDVIETFEHGFPLLQDNGIFIVEDTICYKQKECRNRAYKDHLEYFFQFVPFLNQWRRDGTEGIHDHCVDPFKIMKKTNDPIEQGVDKIEFGCSFIAIHKKVRTHWIP
jgi:hypothetical protein